MLSSWLFSISFPLFVAVLTLQIPLCTSSFLVYARRWGTLSIPSSVASPGQYGYHGDGSSAIPLFAKRKKESMAAKRKRRSQATQKKKQTLEESTSQLPPSKLDFKTTPKPPSLTQATVVSAAIDGNKEDSDSNNNPNEKAKELVRAQQESVQMLTHVANQIEALDVEKLVSKLNNQGYFVVNDFLQSDIAVKIQQECESIYQQNDMTADVTNLGTGEFIVALEGGQEQYPKCPRSIELIVSLTNKLSARLNNVENYHGPVLDDRACAQATARVFDRSSLKASLELLLGANDDMDTVLQNVATSKYQTVVERDEQDETSSEDLRKLSLCYFAVPSSWDESCGGGISFQNDDNSETSVDARRNRLVLWKSDAAFFRKEPFRGSEEMPIAVCIELHLLEKR